MSQPKLFECFQCQKNGFPQVMVRLAGKDENGQAIRQEPDGSPHIHKTKLAPKSGYGGATTQQTMNTTTYTPPLSGQKTRDESIENMHKENQEGYAEYRKVMRDQVDATRYLADAIIELARSMRDKGAVQAEEDKF